MAHREKDVMEKIKRTNPQAHRIMKVFDECLAKTGGPGGAVVTTTDDMTEEEQEMALFQGFLKEGYPVDAAENKARAWQRTVKEFAEQNRIRRANRNK